jgi:hypothetical protein
MARYGAVCFDMLCLQYAHNAFVCRPVREKDSAGNVCRCRFAAVAYQPGYLSRVGRSTLAIFWDARASAKYTPPVVHTG